MKNAAMPLVGTVCVNESACVRLFLLRLLTASMLSCLFVAKLQASTIWQSPIGVVEVVPAEQTNSNLHPQNLQENDLFVALRSINVKNKAGFSLFNRKKNKKAAPLFSDSDIRLLTPHLTKAFNSATSNEDVTFSLLQNQTSSGSRLLAGSEVVSNGRMFFDKEHLNIIFGAALSNPESGLDNSAVTLRYGGISTSQRVEADLGSRDSASSLRVVIVEGDVVQIATVNGKQRKDWIRVSIDATSNADIASLSEQQIDPAPTQPESDQVTTVVANQQDSLDSTIESKLGKLKELRDKGLISEEVYTSQSQKILDEEL